MADKNSLYVDVDNNKLIINWMSSHKTTTLDDNNNETHFKFTKIYIDTSKTYNCKNEPSTIADSTVITLDSEVDADLTDYEIPFSDIISCSDEDIKNEILFIWIEEVPCDSSGEPDYTHVINGKLADSPTRFFGVTLSVKTFYNLLLSHIDIQSECDCNVDCSDVNFMLAWNGFNLAKVLEDYHKMIEYWNILHRMGTVSNIKCGCNG